MSWHLTNNAFILIFSGIGLVRPNAVNLSHLALKLSPCRHSGESRNPGFLGFLDPGFRLGDAVGKGTILKLTALGPTPVQTDQFGNRNGDGIFLFGPLGIIWLL
jgi:hypothetical protein